MSTTTAKTIIEFDDKTVRMFMLASIFWGVIALMAGVFIAFQLNFHFLSLDLSWLTFGRLRPLHTNAAIFAFVGNMIFAGVYHSTQRLCKVRLASNLLSKIHFWGWQSVIVLAAITLPLGFTRGKEYAELIWPINILVTVIWVIFAINFFWTLAKRNEPTLYVTIWFYIATIVTVALLYVVNHLSLPTSFLHSYPIFGGVQDALVQWWYGHNAVAFFLTTPILGIMYYYVPKAAQRPVYSYRLSIVHFWSLVFIYIWAGPHHLLNTALPFWLQALGMLFSLMLWAPSWGGMLNGLLTLRGAWDKLRKDPILKFFAAAVTFYGMATFEGPLMAIRAVNALSHYTDWTIGHVHGGTLGWNGFMAAGMFYWMAPRLWNRPLHSIALANFHFWLGLVGILLYIGAMWTSGITFGLMQNSTSEGGTILTYPNFLDILTTIRPMLLFRAIGGTLYLLGWILLVYNIGRTIWGAKVVNGQVEVFQKDKDAVQNVEYSMNPINTFFNPPTLYFGIGVFSLLIWMLGSDLLQMAGLFIAIATFLAAIVHYQISGARWAQWYDTLIGNWIPFTTLTFIAVAIGGSIQIIPTVILERDDNIEDRLQIPYTPLELAGRDIYVSEGCYNCHSQMIRTMIPDVLRYGENSRLGESIYDHPFQWGSKRTGPDLAREGGKRPNSWHYDHMMDPRNTSPGSIMPNYPWLFLEKTDIESLPSKINVQRKLGVPYPEDWSDDQIIHLAEAQASKIAVDLEDELRATEADKKIVALIAYLQKIGKSTTVIKGKKPSYPEENNF